MKIDELKKAIRGLVREEVRKAVAEEVSKAMGKVLVEMVKEIKSNDLPRINENIEESTEEEVPEIINKSQKLRNVLAETAKYSKPLKHLDSSLADLMDGGFDRIGQNESVGIVEPQPPASNMDFLKQMVGTPSNVPQQKSVLDSGADIPDVLKGVFKKDFRAVMKKMDEQKRNGGGGYINPNTIMGG